MVWRGNFGTSSINYCFLSNGVEVLVNILGNRFYLGGQLLLNLEHVVLVILGDEIDGETEVTETTRTPNSVQVGVRRAREVKVNHYID